MPPVKNKQEEPEVIDITMKAATLSHGDLAEFSRILGKNIRGPADLLEQCKKLSTIRTEGVEIVFEPGVLQRLKSRCPTGVPFSAFLCKQVNDWAHAFVGW
jgi:hypothetical protein